MTEPATPRSFAAAVDIVAHQSTNERGERMVIADIAARIGRPDSYLRKATSQYDDAHPLRGDLIVPLTLATRNYALINYLARECGGVFIQMPAVESADHGDIVRQTTTVVGEFGDVLADLRTALADGHISTSESDRVSVQAYEAIAETLRLVKLVHLKAHAPAPVKERV